MFPPVHPLKDIVYRVDEGLGGKSKAKLGCFPGVPNLDELNKNDLATTICISIKQNYPHLSTAETIALVM